MLRNLHELFSLLEKNEPDNRQTDLFSLSAESENAPVRQYEQADLEFISAYYESGFNPACRQAQLKEPARSFYNLSGSAFSSFVHAWMSELPIEAEILEFGRRVLAAKDRNTAEKAATDRGYEDTRIVLNAAAKVYHERHLLNGILRFSPDETGEYIARCAPDHLTIPALGEHFTSRFGECAWAIIDEKRKLCIHRNIGESVKIINLSNYLNYNDKNNGVINDDEWEKLWQHYHKTINNESRNNPSLQRQFMPKRYWKYISELKSN